MDTAIVRCGVTFRDASTYDRAQQSAQLWFALAFASGVSAGALSASFIAMIALMHVIPWPLGPILGSVTFVSAGIVWIAFASITWWLCVIDYCNNEYVFDV